MNSSTSRSRSRSRSQSRSESRESRRRSPRSGRHPGSGGAKRRDLSRSRRGRSRSKDQGTPHRPHFAMLVPVTQVTRHEAEESSDSSEDEDKLEGTDKIRRSGRWMSQTSSPRSRSRPVKGSSTSSQPSLSRRSGWA